ncbi:MAG: hypothetical protein M1548_10380 [Actinobacteria bacterium]|nr:hypothetical protein [Actinomycetota bacterium]
MTQLQLDVILSIDPEKRRTVLALLASQVRWDLVRFFRANPFTIHTAQGLARIVGRRVEQVEVETKALVHESVLRRLSQDEDFPPIYAYEPNADLRLLIELVEQLTDGRLDFFDELRKTLADLDQEVTARSDCPHPTARAKTASHRRHSARTHR